MERVSITEAKNSLSAIVDRARAGETVVITDRGIPVAELGPARALSDDERLARLERQGIVRRGRGEGIPAWFFDEPPPEAGSSVVEALLEERREGR